MRFILAVVDQKETYWSLLHNGPHWLFELTVEVVTDIPAFFIGRYFWKRHHDKAHEHEHEHEHQHEKQK